MGVGVSSLETEVGGGHRVALARGNGGDGGLSTCLHTGKVRAAPESLHVQPTHPYFRLTPHVRLNCSERGTLFPGAWTPGGSEDESSLR